MYARPRGIVGSSFSRSRSSVVMRATQNDEEIDVKSDKEPWQRGLETYVFFNGNPLEKLVPFLPKTDTTFEIE
jgi:hypothetical protein